MNIVIFDSVSDHYGSSRICRLIIRVLRDCGHNVKGYVCYEHLPTTQQYAKSIQLPILVMSNLRREPLRYICNFLYQIFKFKRAIPALLTKSNLVYCNTLGTLPVAWLSKLYGIPTVLHLHETANSKIIQYLGRFLMPQVADRIICVSDAVATSWRINKHYKTSVIHNGIPDFDKAKLANILGNRPYDLCYVGRLTEKKGICFLLSALELLCQFPPSLLKEPLKVVIVGGALPGQPLPSEIKKVSSHRCIKITYLGEVPNAAEVFLQSKVACVPSMFNDPFPTVVLEAMRAGCAVVASELGGAGEALADARGELVSPGDTHSLINAILRQNSEWSPETANHNRQVFMRHFTFSGFSDRLLSLDILQTDRGS